MNKHTEKKLRRLINDKFGTLHSRDARDMFRRVKRSYKEANRHAKELQRQ